MSTILSYTENNTLKTLCLVSILLGIALRFCALFGDLWLDEIWSLNLAESIRSPIELFTKVRFDNSHPLNSLWMYLVGPSASFYVYRLPSLGFSLATLYLVYRLLSKDGALVARLGTILFSLSYPFVLYGTEARGYSGLIFFVLLAWCVQREIQNTGVRNESWYWLSVILGFLSHATFVFFFLPSLLFSLSEAVRRKRSWVDFLRLQFVPIVFAAAYYAFYIRYLQPGGGPLRMFLEVQMESLSVPFGGPAVTPQTVLLAAIWGIAAFSIVLAGLYSMRKEASVSLYCLGAVVVPVSLALFRNQQVVFLRYLLVPIVFQLILVAKFLAQKISAGGPHRALSFGVLALIVCGSIERDLELVRYARGNYSDALGFMIANSKEAAITVSGTHDFRDEMLVEFYARRLGAQDKVIYLPSTESSQTSEWLIRYKAAEELSSSGQGYCLQNVYRSASLSGESWYLYRKE